MSTLSTNNVFIVSTIMVVCLALMAILKDQVEQFNKIRVAATAIHIDEEAVKNQRVRDCVEIPFVTSVHLPPCFQYIDLLLCRV